MAISLIAGALLPLVAEVAPDLIGAITGSDRAERVAERVAETVGAVAGVQIEAPADAAQAVASIRADPAALLQAVAGLRAIEAEYLADRRDARARDLEIRRTGGRNRRADMLIGVVATLLTAAMATLVFVPEMTEDATVAIVGLAGGLSKALWDVIAFEFGSSRGSREKDAAIEALSAPRPTPISLPAPERAGGFRR